VSNQQETLPGMRSSEMHRERLENLLGSNTLLLGQFDRDIAEITDGVDDPDVRELLTDLRTRQHIDRVIQLRHDGRKPMIESTNP